MQNILKNSFLSLSFLLCFSLFGATDNENNLKQNCLEQTYSSFNLKHREHRGLGYDTGYTSAEFFLTLSEKNWYQPILDLRGHVFNNGDFAANGGIGVRLENESQSFAFGFFGYYDFRHFKNLNTSQASIALEFLSHYVDFRMNGYLPFNSYDYEKIDLDNGFIGFKEHKPFHNGISEYAFPSADASLGGRIPVVKDYFSIYLSTGPYYLFKQSTKNTSEGNAFGWRANIDFNVTHWFDIGAEYTYDRIYNSRLVGYVSINIPLGKRSIKTKSGCEKFSRNMNMMTQKVRRNEIIPMLKKNVEVESGNTDFIFVDNLGVIGTGSGNGGDGTFEDPFSDLKLAGQNSKPGDIIYVYPGDGTTSGYSDGITLQNDQNLHSASLDIRADGFFIPAQATTKPTITNTEGSAVTLANGVTVNGFIISNPRDSAMVGDNIGGFTLTNNELSLGLSTNGIVVTNIRGASSITDNVIEAAKTSINSGIKLSSRLNAGRITVKNNEINSGFKSAFSYEGDSDKGMNLTFENNTIRNPFGNGISVSNLPSSSIITLKRNTVESKNTLDVKDVGITQISENSLIASADSNAIQILNAVNAATISSNTLSTSSSLSSSSSSSSSSAAPIATFAINMTQGDEALGNITIKDNTIKSGFSEALQYVGSESVDLSLLFDDNIIKKTDGNGLDITKLSENSLVRIENAEITSQKPVYINGAGSVNISNSTFVAQSDTTAVQINNFKGPVSFAKNSLHSSDQTTSSATALLLSADEPSSGEIIVDDNKFLSKVGIAFKFDGNGKGGSDLAFTKNVIENPIGLGVIISDLPKTATATLTSNTIESLLPIEINSGGEAVINKNTLNSLADTPVIFASSIQDNFEISRNTITGASVGTSTAYALNLSPVSGSVVSKTITIDNNTINFDSMGAVVFKGKGSNGLDFVFSNNKVTNSEGLGVSLQSLSSSTTTTISGNRITSKTPISTVSIGTTTISDNTLISAIDTSGIDLSDMTSPVTISGNTIAGSRSNGSVTTSGVYIDPIASGPKAISIENNKIRGNYGFACFYDGSGNEGYSLSFVDNTIKNLRGDGLLISEMPISKTIVATGNTIESFAPITISSSGASTISDNTLIARKNTGGIEISDFTHSQTLSGNTITGERSSGSVDTDAIFLSVGSSTSGTVTVDSNIFKPDFATAFSYQGDRTGGLDLVFSGNTITNPNGSGVFIADLISSSSVTINNKNTIESYSPITISSSGASTISDNTLVAKTDSNCIEILNFTGSQTLSGNTLSGERTSTSVETNAILLTVGSATSGTVTVDNNIVKSDFAKALNYLGDKTGGLDLVFSGNTITNPDGNGVVITDLISSSLVTINKKNTITSKLPIDLQDIGSFVIDDNTLTASNDTGVLNLQDINNSLTVSNNTLSTTRVNTSITAISLTNVAQTDGTMTFSNNTLTGTFHTGFVYNDGKLTNAKSNNLVFKDNKITNSVNTDATGIYILNTPGQSTMSFTGNTIDALFDCFCYEGNNTNNVLTDLTFENNAFNGGTIGFQVYNTFGKDYSVTMTNNTSQFSGSNTFLPFLVQLQNTGDSTVVMTGNAVTEINNDPGTPAVQVRYDIPSGQTNTGTNSLDYNNNTVTSKSMEVDCFKLQISNDIENVTAKIYENTSITNKHGFFALQDNAGPKVCFDFRDNTSTSMEIKVPASNQFSIISNDGTEAGFKALNPDITSFTLSPNLSSSSYVTTCP